MSLPVETAATRCSDPNTATCRDDWLREGAGWGCSVQHITVVPLKFKHIQYTEAKTGPVHFLYFINNPAPIFPATHLSLYPSLPSRFHILQSLILFLSFLPPQCYVS